MASANAIFYPSLRAYQIWGTRQGVGKTIASTILCLGAIQRRGPKGAFYNVAFSKPVDDAKYLEELDYSRLKSVFFTWRKGKALPQWFDTRKPVDEKLRANDGDLLRSIYNYAKLRSDYSWSDRGLPPAGSWLFLETLAGVESRLPSDNCQADVYRELQLPGLLVGDTQPGGVENTITAFESLRQRDHDVQSVIVFKDPHDNYTRIAEHFDKLDIPCVALRTIPERLEPDREKKSMLHYCSSMARANVVKDLLKHLQARHAERIKALKGLKEARASEFELK